jgi:tRNA(fMet)-specific endonuclease VapC
LKPKYVLDSDTVIDSLRGKRSVRERLDAISPDDVAVSAMTVSELRFGAIGPASARRMMETAAFLSQVAVLPFTLSEALVHAEIRLALRNTPIGFADMIIAATALAVPAILVTSNAREFARVPGLQIENWR